MNKSYPRNIGSDLYDCAFVSYFCFLLSLPLACGRTRRGSIDSSVSMVAKVKDALVLRFRSMLRTPKRSKLVRIAPAWPALNQIVISAPKHQNVFFVGPQSYSTSPVLYISIALFNVSSSSKSITARCSHKT